MTVEPGTKHLERAVRAIVALGSGLDRSRVIRGQENVPFPAPPVATVTLITDLPDGFVWTRDERVGNRVYTDPTFTDGPTIDEQVFLSSELTYSVQWFGEFAADYARQFSLWARSPGGTSEMARRGLTFYRTGAITDLSAITDSKWEDRRGLELVLGITTTDTQDVGIIETLDMNIYPEYLAEEPAPANCISAPVPSDKQEP